MNRRSLIVTLLGLPLVARAFGRERKKPVAHLTDAHMKGATLMFPTSSMQYHKGNVYILPAKWLETGHPYWKPVTTDVALAFPPHLKAYYFDPPT